MRKFILISALLLASASAQAGENRSLSLAGIPTVTAEVTKPIVVEAPKPIAQVAVRLAQAATTANDAAPVQVAQAPAAPAPAPVQAQAPVQTTAPAATTTTTTATTAKTATTETKPSKTAKKVRRESTEAKARRIAARYGVYW